ncbi:hypothetical protein [Streptomyces sp. SID3343]|uniref:hypothetical protein n=1 Tax=Streptomyces sp. SID3343 TaxID=2690260 RepID=UPI00136B62BE|nr:hypothetical protein [Streptomyces sp. SID3343]MYW00216.1 hypothetical protein [Streptomyces sp. SID3343]
MTVSVTRTGATSAAIEWTPDDDWQEDLARVVDTGNLERALTALSLADRHLAAVDQSDRAAILRSTAYLATELTRRVRLLAVLAHDEGMSWATLAGNLTGDVGARSSARSTYEAGLRQMGRSTSSTDGKKS